MREGLTVEGLTVRYNGRAVLSDVSLAVEPGEVFGIVGPSGAGKSSLLMALGGAIPSSGTVRIGSQEVSLLPARLRRFGHVYQEFRLFEWMSVFDNIAFPCRAQGWDDQEAQECVLKQTQRVGLSGQETRIVRDMSGGERQRVALARAIVAKPRALFLDEPFSHLDPPLRDELRRDLMISLAETRIPVIVVTHDHEEAFRLCTRIGLLFEGTLVQTGLPTVVVNAPSSAAAAAFLGYSNRIVGRVRLGEPGMAVVSTESGEWHGCVPAPVRSDQAEVLCRPTDIALGLSPDGRPNTFSARLLSWQRGLARTEAIIQLQSGTTWAIQVSNDVPTPSHGEMITCHVLPDRMLIYDAPGVPSRDLPL
jgi:ABC-type Fe3+/spermidine/putrescine transport system ATPase subunit